MKITQANGSGSPILGNILADLGLSARGPKLHELVHDGLPFAFLDRIANVLQVPRGVITKAICVSPATLTRRAKAGRFNAIESDRLVALVGVFQEAIVLFEGDVSAAIGWMSTPVRGLGKCPLDMLETRVETQAVLNLIGRLENGVLA
jgi:putative toxin-antitoxin system antitoxin component (TIGR02293 family)